MLSYQTVIEFIHGLFNFAYCNGRQIPVFREVLPDESIGILIQSTFPGGTRMREVDVSLKVTGHAFVVGQFLVIVISNGMHSVCVGSESIHNSGPDGCCCLVGYGSDDRKQRLALDQCDQSDPVTPCRSRCRPLCHRNAFLFNRQWPSDQ